MTEQRQVVNASLRYRHSFVSSLHYVRQKRSKVQNSCAGKFSLEDMGLITVSIAAADLTREYAVKKGWIPENIKI